VKSLRTWKCECCCLESISASARWAEQNSTTCSRVAELEQENARLQALAHKSASHEGNPRELMSEIEQLRSRLAAAEQRERELNSQLSKRPPTVKTELSEPRLPASPARHPAFPGQVKSSDKTSASLSLLVSLSPSLLVSKRRSSNCVSSDIGLTLCPSFHFLGLHFPVRGTHVWFIPPLKYSSQLRCSFQDGLSFILSTRLRLARSCCHGPRS
jgi:hypothetical protein